MSITGSNNPFACEPVVFANANTIVSLGIITRDGNEFTFSVGFVWKINGVTYQNTAPVVLTIAEASTGFQRIDNALLNTSNTIELQQGLESDSIALQPVAPDTNIILTSWNISGTAIGDTEASILGTQFKQKNEAQKITQVLGGTDAVIELRTFGQQYYEVIGPVTSVAGFSMDLITSSPTSEAPYSGKDFFFENNTANNVTLKNVFSPVDIPFNFGADLVVPISGIVWMKYYTTGLKLVMKSWSDSNSILTESVTISNRWTLTNADVYYRSRADFGGFNVDTISVSTASATIGQTTAGLSASLYCASKSKHLKKIYFDAGSSQTTISTFKLGVFAFQRYNTSANNNSAINLINLGEFTLTKPGNQSANFWEITPSNIEIPAGYLVSCVLMRVGGTGTEINCSMTFKFDDYVV